jgi:hypothetical protein
VPDLAEHLVSNSDGSEGRGVIEEDYYYTKTSVGEYWKEPLNEKLFINYQFVKQ